MATTRLNIDGAIGGLPLGDFTQKTGGSGTKAFQNFTRFGLSGGITRYARNFTGKVEQTLTMSGGVQASDSVIAGVITKTAYRTITGGVQAQDATITGSINGFKLVTGGTSAEDSTTTGSITRYPSTGWNLTDFTVDYSSLSTNSPFYNDTYYQDITAGPPADKCHYEATTTPDGHSVSMSGNGEFTITGTLTQNQSFTFQIYDVSDGTFGTTGSVIVQPSTADVTFSGSVQAGDSAVTGAISSFTVHTMSGGVQPDNATVTGELSTGDTVNIFGGVQSQGATVTGSIERVIKIIGGVQSGDATVSGAFTRIVSFSADVQSDDATVSGQIGPIPFTGTIPEKRGKIRKSKTSRSIKFKSSKRILN